MRDKSSAERGFADLISGLENHVSQVSNYVNREANRGPIADVADEYVRIRNMSRRLADVSKEFEKVRRKLGDHIIPERFTEEGIKTMTLDSGARVTVQEVVRASIPANKREDAKQWLRDNALDELITETVNASTLSSLAREFMEEGRELDPDLFNVAIMPQTLVQNR